MKLPERLARARKRAGLTQRELAKRLGISPATVAGWETANDAIQHGIRKDRLVEVARILKLDVLELLG